MPGAGRLRADRAAARLALEEALTAALTTGALGPVLERAAAFHTAWNPAAGHPGELAPARLVAGELADAVVPVWNAHGDLWAPRARQVAAILEAHERERTRADAAEAMLEAARILLPLDPTQPVDPGGAVA
jgi:hypothetical protein